MAPQSDGAGTALSPAALAATESESANERDVLRLFSYLWAAAVLFHIGSFDLWSQSWLEVLAAIWVLARPGSTLALSVLMVLHLQATLPVTPRTANHALFASVIAAAFLLSVAVLGVRRRSAVDRAELVRVFGPPVRWSLIALYFFAAFHKLNADWFDPSVSCGAMFYTREREVFPFLPASPTLAALSIHASLGFEIVIPLLLLFRSTRHLGILTGMVFHWLLATNPLSGFYNFSSMLFAVFALFASSQFVAEAADLIGRRRVRWTSRIVTAIFAGYAFVAHPLFETIAPSSRNVSNLVWWVYGTSLLAVFGTLVWQRRFVVRPGRDFALQPMLVVVPLLVVLNGAAPHLGLHTTATWAMFSNLRTEAGRSNHLLIPATAQIFDYQRDVVQIVRSSDTYLQSAAKRYIPYFEVRRRPDASIVYVRRGVQYTFNHAADDPEFRAAPPLAAAFMVFRPVDRRLKQPCVH
jgi:hypothetical protein